jgi:adenosylhomocysteine nucleosidase
MTGELTAVLAPMVSELRPFLASSSLSRQDFATGTVYRGRYGTTEVVATITGIGMTRATEVTRRVVDELGATRVIVMGIAGGVDHALAIGDVVVPERVTDRDGADYRPVAMGEHVSRGVLVTSDTLFGPDDIAALRAGGVVAVDMETSAIAAVCAVKGVPVSVFRAISDHVGEATVDDAVLGLMRADGSPDMGKIAKYLAVHPGQLGRLRALGRGTKVATAAAAGAVRHALSSAD